MATGVYTTTPFEVKSTVAIPPPDIFKNSLVSNINQSNEVNQVKMLCNSKYVISVDPTKYLNSIL